MDKREVGSALKAGVGCLAGFVGGLLLVAAIPVSALLIMIGVAWGDYANDEVYSGAVGYGVLIGSLGAALCYVSWRLLRRPGKQELRSPTGSTGGLSMENQCPNCGCHVADGSETCRWCGQERPLG